MFLCVAALLCALLCATVDSFPHNALESVLARHRAAEASGSGPGSDEPVRGTVKVVQVSPQFLQQSGFFRRGTPFRVPPHHRGLLPPFLALGRPGPAVSNSGALPGPRPQLEGKGDTEAMKRQGLDMWRRAMEKSGGAREALPVPISLMDSSKQSCAAVPFTQRVSAPGCDAVTVPNRLCVGLCLSLYVPPGAAPCSRCAPVKTRVVSVPLRCRGAPGLREKRVVLVEECKCETGGQAPAPQTPRHKGLKLD
ncbi:DAN domain family member 5 [Amia ocellicauda]|uniref:DAN domain family member 5 n=1 Tax=Amia ocellicauda TaxID=2972642 RepID=UPI00346467A1